MQQLPCVDSQYLPNGPWEKKTHLTGNGLSKLAMSFYSSMNSYLSCCFRHFWTLKDRLVRYWMVEHGFKDFSVLGVL
jgi:hypothetical protein